MPQPVHIPDPATFEWLGCTWKPLGSTLYLGIRPCLTTFAGVQPRRTWAYIHHRKDFGIRKFCAWG